ncbi:MAG: GNAT family N-acetyltransferase [Pseudomonadota bacterium]|nr:GNAT family N-acetyltransferase [Pseudomonadota bacterium]
MIRLRPCHLVDAPAITALASDRRVSQYTQNIPYPYDQSMAEAWIKRCEPLIEEKKLLVRAIVLTDSEQLVGIISLMNIQGKKAELGYWIGVDYWRRGIVTEAVRQMLTLGTEAFGLERMIAKHHELNPASGRVLLKNGFTRMPSLENSEEPHFYYELVL